jgi:hypothetical protein
VLLQIGHNGRRIGIAGRVCQLIRAPRRIHAALTIAKRFTCGGAVCRFPQALIKVDGTFA